MVYTRRGDRRAGRRAGEASGHLGHHRRHLQPMVFDGIGYHNFVHARPGVARPGDLRRFGVQDLWHAGLARGLASPGPKLVAQGGDHAQLQPHHQPAGSRSPPRRWRRSTGPQDVPQAKCAEFAGKRDRWSPRSARSPAWSARGRRARSTRSRTSPSRSARAHDGTTINNDVEFCAALLEAKGVACVPGSAFGEPRAMRISYTCPTAQLAAGPGSASRNFSPS